jgi:hypothetical protein
VDAVQEIEQDAQNDHGNEDGRHDGCLSLWCKFDEIIVATTLLESLIPFRRIYRRVKMTNAILIGNTILPAFRLS